ncbi:MAG: hypothetical protein EU536_02280 [Promethearchaeota archaeon]|nr:MAG: hypothetical protein EU536_02280 [Candidatus Lokiarchaeota archaeon]
MSERSFSNITGTMIINAIILYVEFTLFQYFGAFIPGADNPMYAIFTFIALINIVLIALNFILTVVKSKKGEISQKLDKKVAIITLITVFILLFQLFLTFFMYIGIFE